MNADNIRRMLKVTRWSREWYSSIPAIGAGAHSAPGKGQWETIY